MSGDQSRVRCRVNKLSCGSAHTQFNLFFGELDQPCFDPTRWWWWHESTPFLAYLVKFGRKLIDTQETLKKPISNKWENKIPPSTSPKWRIIWHKHKAHEEATFFLWSTIHKVVAVNEWGERISAEIDKSCPHCGSLIVESVEHTLYNHALAQQIWRYATSIMWQLFVKSRNLGLWNSFLMMRCLFDQPLSKSLKPFSGI